MKTAIFKFPRKINLANIPTPVQKMSFNGKQFLVKRDDFTGLEMSGNKVRKLEYLLFQAKVKKADYIFTCGGEQSNHSRATVFAAHSSGFKTKLFLWGKDSLSPDGNLFLDKTLNSELRFLNKKQYGIVNELMEVEKDNLEKKGKNVFIIPEGGSSPYGVWGYIEAYYETLLQRDNKINALLTACGSGGTSAGLLLGSILSGMNTKIFAVNVLYPAKVMRERILSLAEITMKQFKFNIKLDESLLEIIDGYSAEGYKNISDDKIDVIKSFASQSGILLDPAYTGKAFFAYQELFLNSQKKNKVLFIHTGGLFGVFSKKRKYLG